MPQTKLESALKLVRRSILDPTMPRKAVAKLGALIAGAIEKCKAKSLKGLKPDLTVCHDRAKDSLDKILRARDRLIDCAEVAPRLEALDVFDQICLLTYVVEKLRYVASRIRSDAYQRSVDVNVDQRFYKGRFLIAIYDGEDPIHVFENTREASNVLGIPERRIAKALSLVFRGKRSSILIDGKKRSVHFIYAFD